MKWQPVHLSMLSWCSFYQHNITFKPLAAFEHNYHQNNGQWWQRNESGWNVCHLSLKRIFDESRGKFSKGVENTVGKRRNCLLQAISPFPTVFKRLLLQKHIKKGVFGIGLTKTPHVLFNPFPHNDTFWCPGETSLLKTLWEEEKLLVTSNFSFSHSVFYQFG